MFEYWLDICFNLTGVYLLNSFGGIFVFTLITALILPISLAESIKFIPSNGLISLVCGLNLFINALVIFILGCVCDLVWGLNCTSPIAAVLNSGLWDWIDNDCRDCAGDEWRDCAGEEWRDCGGDEWRDDDNDEWWDGANEEWWDGVDVGRWNGTDNER